MLLPVRAWGLRDSSFLSLHQLQALLGRHSSLVAPGDSSSVAKTAQSVVKLSEAMGATPALALDCGAGFKVRTRGTKHEGSGGGQRGNNTFPEHFPCEG